MFKPIKDNCKALKALQELEQTTNKQIVNNFKLINQLEQIE